MRNLIVLAATLAIHASVLGAFGLDVVRTHPAPAGEVIVTQLPIDADLATYASAVDARREPVL